MFASLCLSFYHANTTHYHTAITTQKGSRHKRIRDKLCNKIKSSVKKTLKNQPIIIHTPKARCLLDTIGPLAHTPEPGWEQTEI